MSTELRFSEAEIRALLEREEGQYLEFKSLWDRSHEPPSQLDRRAARDFAAEHVAAFANADGGTLLLGVENDGTPSGHGYPEDALADLMAVPDRRLRPVARCIWQRMTLGGKEILVAEVPMAAEAVMVDGNGFPYRVGDRVIREPQEVINARKQAYRRIGYEQRLAVEASLGDLDLDLACRFLSGSPFRDRPPAEMLARYGLVVPRAGSMAVTNAALLLFAQGPLARWHPRAGIRFARVAGTERFPGSRRNVSQIGRIDVPLALALPEAHRLAREHIRRSERLHDLFFREMPEYPEFAWQEAIVNAFAHRDYEDRTREIEVWFYDDRMEVVSPGEPVPPVTIELLRTRRPIHASRNPLLVRALADAGLMREEGEGIPRIYEEMEQSFLNDPQFGASNGEFRIQLRNEPIFSGPGAEWQWMLRDLPLTASQKRTLLLHPDGFTNEDYRRLNNVDRDEAYRQIQEMVDLGVISGAEARGRGAVYRIAPDLDAERVFVSARLPKLRSQLTTKGYVQNADYRELFEVTRVTAVRELRRLVDGNYLRLEGERRGARYVAGSALRQI